MLKKSLASLPGSLVLALVCAGAMAQASAQSSLGRIGFVYTERLMTESKLAKAADAKLQSEFSKRQ
jgi:outer membrane protein